MAASTTTCIHPGGTREPRLDAGEDILRLLGRFALATPAQIGRHLGCSAAAVERAQQTLTAEGLVRVVPLVRPEGTTPAITLTPAGLRRLPALMPKQRLTTRAAEALLAAVDVAQLAEAEGGGAWLTWAEAVRAGRVVGGEQPQAADGLLLPPGSAEAAAPAVPVCIVLNRTRRPTLRRRLLAAARAAGGAPARVYAPPRLCADLRRDAEGLGATFVPWVPTEALAGGAARRREALTPKRLRALIFLGRFGHATVDQLAAEQGTHSTAASIMLATMERLGLVQRHREHHLHKDVYSATHLGLCAAGLDLAPAPRIPPQRRHALALVDLARQLCAETGGRWQTNREWAAAQARHTQGPVGAGPDGVLQRPDGTRVAVELELSSQARHTVLAFAGAQLAGGGCREVWYVVAPEWHRRYAGRLEGLAGVRVRAWEPPDRLGGPRGFRAARPTRQPAAPRILGRPRRGAPPAGA